MESMEDQLAEAKRKLAIAEKINYNLSKIALDSANEFKRQAEENLANAEAMVKHTALVYDSSLNILKKMEHLLKFKKSQVDRLREIQKSNPTNKKAEKDLKSVNPGEGIITFENEDVSVRIVGCNCVNVFMLGKNLKVEKHDKCGCDARKRKLDEDH